MKLDEFAFANRQLAEMLRAGIPLEGALQRLCQEMQRGELRQELALLEADLARGIPLKEALAARQLPAFYVQMLNVGVASNNLPGILTLVADYYERGNLIWTRLKGLMVYPFILLGGLFVVSLLMAMLMGILRDQFSDIYRDLLEGAVLPALTRFYFQNGLLIFWLPVLLVAATLVVSPAMAFLPAFRARWRWKLPGFREASLWQSASALQLLLAGGCTLDQSLGLLAELEKETPAGEDLARWQERVRSGITPFQGIAEGSRVFPPLFIWIVNSAREEMADGFRQAAEIYHQRATYRGEVLLNATLPVAVIVLGLAVFVHVFAFVFAAFLPLIHCFGKIGS